MTNLIFWISIFPFLILIIVRIIDRIIAPHSVKGKLKLLVVKVITNLPRIKLYRFFRGGLWIHFDNGQWIQTTWINREDFPKEYLNHPQGGEFHKSLTNILKIEEYKHGNN